MKKLVVLISTAIILFMIPVTVSADNGGQADVPGKIIFYEESSSQEPKESSSELTEKPVGRLPNTGEIVQKTILWMGLGLILCVIIFLIGKKRSEHDEKER